jgi:hypothetical protein
MAEKFGQFWSNYNCADSAVFKSKFGQIDGMEITVWSIGLKFIAFFMAWLKFELENL